MKKIFVLSYLNNSGKTKFCFNFLHAVILNNKRVLLINLQETKNYFKKIKKHTKDLKKDVLSHFETIKIANKFVLLQLNFDFQDDWSNLKNTWINQFKEFENLFDLIIINSNLKNDQLNEFFLGLSHEVFLFQTANNNLNEHLLKSLNIINLAKKQNTKLKISQVIFNAYLKDHPLSDQTLWRLQKAFSQQKITCLPYDENLFFANAESLNLIKYRQWSLYTLQIMELVKDID